MDLVEKMPFSDPVKNMVGTMYNRYTASVFKKSETTEPLEKSSGARQGCPLSLLLFKLAIKPLLQQIQNCRIESKHKNSVA